MFFLMSLALRLGKTLAELKQTLTASELRMWIEYNRISPIGDIRGDILAAQISSAVYNAQGGDVDINDALIRWHDDPSEEDTSHLEAFLEKLSDD